MKLKFIKYIPILILPLFGVLFSCSKDQGASPLEHSTIAPGEISNIAIQNLPGKAKLTYSLPNDKDLLYIVAQYTLENGTKMEVKSSYYNNSMILEGFTGLTEKEVTLYAVNRSEVKSKPVKVSVAPLRAPVYSVFDSMTLQPDFGGIRIKADNPTNENLAFLIMTKNIQGNWEPLPNSIYTTTSEINQALRGFDTIKQQFALVVRDRWLNKSDTLFQEVKPIYETLMPKSNYAAIHLANDSKVIGTYPVKNLWDGQFLEYWGSYFTDRTIDVGNHLVTFDVGKVTKLSRLKLWQFSEPIGGQRLYYYLGAIKKFRIWGSNTLNDGNLSGWTLLGDFDIKKPSGLPYGQENNDDLLAAIDGQDFEISIDMPAVRYLRIECIENWSGGQFMAVSEVQVYGNPNF
ncbi:DUF4959 domain-containing protein [Flavobacterium cellulosilyticum]|uniref:DUF4959 domain-containing protein n=1 Tax=Flavobacterium cellulosilyticum TaxID=2541731 RepID=A0A4R5C4F1_9FLAO|nr:DUF4959 domain-containing protein [Flavobacterium cellulosilyticum]TDD93835.1 DUF4959 domain-containing protein [Flavobacterium cellulosilyticum]